MSIKAAARDFGMLDWTLRNLLHYQQEGKKMVGSAWKTALMEEAEKDLPECICILSVPGFRSTTDKIKNLVQDKSM